MHTATGSVGSAAGENDGESVMVGVAAFDNLAGSEAADLLRPCCASARWVGELVSGRPYGSLRALIAASDDIIADLQWVDLSEALAAHPRIGDRVRGGDREARWSRQEQSSAGPGAGSTSAPPEALVAGNLAYEQRFGHVFLICATGLTAAEVLADLHARLDNPTDLEREVVREQLRRIVRLRLIKTLH